MSKRSVARRKTLQAVQRVGAYLTLTVVQQDENGDLLFSVMPLPRGFAMVTTWLATLWVALTPLMARAWLELGWLAGDVAGWLKRMVGLVGRPVRHRLDGLGLGRLPAAPLHFYLAVNVIASALWWALVSSNPASAR